MIRRHYDDAPLYLTPSVPRSMAIVAIALALALGLAFSVVYALDAEAPPPPKPLAAVDINRVVPRMVRTIPIDMTPAPPPIAEAAPIGQTLSVAEPAHPAREPGDNGSNQGKQEGPAADPHLQGRLVPHPTSADVCQRHGGFRQDYMRRNNWHSWRCVFTKRGAR